MIKTYFLDSLRFTHLLYFLACGNYKRMFLDKTHSVNICPCALHLFLLHNSQYLPDIPPY